MGVTFTSLSDCIRQSDPEGFLRSYLHLVAAGKNLTVPMGGGYTAVKDAWEEILYGVPGGYSDEFLIKVTRMWVQISQRVKRTKDDAHDAHELLHCLDNPLSAEDEKALKQLAQEKVATSAKKTAQSKESRLGVIRSVDVAALTSKSKRTVATVSPQKAKPVKKAKPPSQVFEPVVVERKAISAVSDDFFKVSDDNDVVLRQAVSDGNVDVFLLHYLKRSLYQVRPNLPLSTVLDIILYKWRDILMSEFDSLPSASFLSVLSKRWFQLMTQYGLAHDRAKIKDLIYVLHEGASFGSSTATSFESNDGLPNAPSGNLI